MGQALEADSMKTRLPTNWSGSKEANTPGTEAIKAAYTQSWGFLK